MNARPLIKLKKKQDEIQFKCKLPGINKDAGVAAGESSFLNRGNNFDGKFIVSKKFLYTNLVAFDVDCTRNRKKIIRDA